MQPPERFNNMPILRLSNCALAIAVAGAWFNAQTGETPIVAARARTLTRQSMWRPVSAVPVAFRTFHPQGMVKIGETIFMSSVETKVRPQPFPAPVNGFDRDPGEGVGHLFKMDAKGTLLADLTLGEGAIYHPGGIDYDGKYIWVPVAEYRPNSRSIMYRVDPGTMQATEVFRFADHIGAVVRNTEDHTLHGMSWGSRRFYRWTLDRTGKATNTAAKPLDLRTENVSHYVDYQDCKYIGARRALCTGVTELRQEPGAPAFRLGGLELLNLADGRPDHQVPILLWTSGGLVMTQNPVWIEATSQGLRAYFMPEDDRSTLYVYEVDAR